MMLGLFSSEEALRAVLGPLPPRLPPLREGSSHDSRDAASASRARACSRSCSTRATRALTSSISDCPSSIAFVTCGVEWDEGKSVSH